MLIGVVRAQRLADHAHMTTLASPPAADRAGSTAPAAPPAALVVVSGGTLATGWPQPTPQADPRLLKALPAARQVLALTPAGADPLGAAYARAHPHASWTRVTDTAAMSGLPAGQFDLLVVDRVLAWCDEPLDVLRGLARLAAHGARLVLSLDNHASLATLEQLLQADLTVDPRHAAATGQPRLQSPASAYKLLMDAGWMPTLADAEPVERPASGPAAALQALARASGLASGCPERVLGLRRLVIEARQSFADTATEAGDARFTVVVPTTDEHQLRVNVEASAGLREVGARIVSYRGARHPAEALAGSLPHVDTDWVLFVHQDVYFPAGFGERLNALLAAIPAEERARTLIGFIGLAAARDGSGTAPAGFVIDRLHRADHAAADTGVSIDEVAVLVSRDTVHRMDPALGWHLWATDLCLQSICQHQVFPRLVRLPLFHNSRTGWTLPPAFVRSAHVLAAKWNGAAGGFGPIPTLCGVIDDRFLAAHPRPAE